jgi:hypothetical protein
MGKRSEKRGGKERKKREFLPIFYNPFIFSQSKEGIFIYRVGKHTRGRL